MEENKEIRIHEVIQVVYTDSIPYYIFKSDISIHNKYVTRDSDGEQFMILGVYDRADPGVAVRLEPIKMDGQYKGKSIEKGDKFLTPFREYVESEKKDCFLRNEEESIIGQMAEVCDRFNEEMMKLNYALLKARKDKNGR